MFFKITDAIKGLKQLPKIYNALYEGIVVQFKLVKLHFQNFKTSLNLSKNLGCKVSTISSYYKHMGYYHLEVLAHNGFFLYKSHRIDDIYPNITILDKNDKNFKNLTILLEKDLCKLNFIDFDINKEDIDLTIKFNSISLPFILESLEGSLDSIDKFLLNLKTQLDSYNAVVFGVSVVAEGLKYKKSFNKYLDFLEKQNIYFNKDLSVQKLTELFNKHFPYVSLYYEGSCLFFVLQPELNKIKLKPILPKSDPLEMPFV